MSPRESSIILMGIRHMVAFPLTIAFSSIIAFALYAGPVYAQATSAADLGGPLNFVIIPAVGLLAGLVLCLFVYFPLTLLAEVIDLRRYPRALGGAVAVLVISLGLTCVGLAAVLVAT